MYSRKISRLRSKLIAQRWVAEILPPDGDRDALLEVTHGCQPFALLCIQCIAPLIEFCSILFSDLRHQNPFVHHGSGHSLARAILRALSATWATVNLPSGPLQTALGVGKRSP